MGAALVPQPRRFGTDALVAAKNRPVRIAPFAPSLLLDFLRENLRLPSGLVMIRPSSTFRWLRTGEAALAAMLSAIQASRESVRLETYLFHIGPLAERFREALVLAARRGAKVRVLIDALGSLNLSAEFWDPLKKAGGEFVW